MTPLLWKPAVFSPNECWRGLRAIWMTACASRFERRWRGEPNSAEIGALKGRYQKHLQRYQADKTRPPSLSRSGCPPRPMNLNVAEHAAWTSVCNILLNLDETITRE